MSCRSLLIVIAWVGIGLLCACSKQSAPNGAASITGVINARMPIDLGRDAQLQLQLTDVSVEGPAVQIAESTAYDLRTLPYAYTLSYDPTLINNAHRYMISARIYSGKQLRFATDSAMAVLTQGNGTTANIPVVAAGMNDSAAAVATSTSDPARVDIFSADLHSDNEIVAYRAGFIGHQISWLEEDRQTKAPASLHARYDFKGALLLHYADSSGFEFNCNESGKPISATRNQQPVEVMGQMSAVNLARNRAALLRSQALAAREIKAHRLATKQGSNQ